MGSETTCSVHRFLAGDVSLDYHRTCAQERKTLGVRQQWKPCPALIKIFLCNRQPVCFVGTLESAIQIHNGARCTD